jgi:dipeptidyl-peptidase-4
MDTPQSNPEGYKLTSPITYANKLKGNLLIIHGTTDDNVHWQNSIIMVNELIRQNKQFQTMFYPGRAHGIHGDNATRHFYQLMTNFILEKL